jgi:hypothetical protein
VIIKIEQQYVSKKMYCCSILKNNINYTFGILVSKKGEMLMIRGTTAQFKFKLPYSYDELTSITIRFWQPNNPSGSLPIYKYKTNCESPVEKEIHVSLRPSETALFSDKYKAKLQLRAQPAIGAPFGCKEQLITVYPMPDDIIDDDPIINPEVPTEEGWIILDGETIVG